MSFEQTFINRQIFLDGLKALFLAYVNLEKQMQQDSFSAGYSEGYVDALRATAQLSGGIEEFLTYKEVLREEESVTRRIIG